MAWGIERILSTFIYLEDISIYKYIYTYMNIYLHVCAWCFYAGRLSDEYEGLYVYIYIYYYHISFGLYSCIHVNLSRCRSLSLSFSFSICYSERLYLSACASVWPSILEQLANVDIYLSAGLYISSILRRTSRYIHPRVYDAFYDRSMANLPQPPLSLLQLIADICRRNATANAENIDKISIQITLVGYF